MSAPEMERPREPEPDQGGGSTRPTDEQSDTHSIATSLATRLTSEHLAQLKASGIDDELILERGYESVRTLTEANDVLVDRGFSRGARQLRPGLLIPLHGVACGIVGHQLRPDVPRVAKHGKTIKYETPKGARMRLDVHPRVRALLADPKVPLFITEGVKKGDAAASRGLCCVALLGVWNWRGRNEHGGTTALADWDAIALNGREVSIAFDSDAMTKRAVASALARLKALLELHGARVRVVYLPGGANGAKVGLDDFLVMGGTVEQLFDLATDEVRGPALTTSTNGSASADGRPDPRTDTANARRFVELHGERVRYVGTWGKWFVWDGKRWRMDDIGRALELTAAVAHAIRREAASAKTGEERGVLWNWAKASESRERRMAMLALAAVDPAVAITHEVLDQRPMLLNVENGTLDLATGELREHRREDLLSKCAPVKYDSDAAAPTWNVFLERVLPDEAVRLFVQRAVGATLTGDVGDQVFHFCHGGGANGKSVFLRTLQALLGPYATQAPSELLVATKHRGHPTELADLFGRRMVVAVEIGAGLRLDEPRVKQLTGGDLVACRRMREDWWSFSPTHKLWIAANHRPVIRGTDEAIWRRVLLIPFAVTIPPDERDPDLLEKLVAELPGILNWAIDGCLVWQRDGLRPPEQVLAATARYREEQDALGDFLSSRCSRVAGARVGAKQLYDDYVAWCAEAGEEPVSGTLFGRMLVERGFEKSKAGTIIYHGLKLLEAADDDAQEQAP